MIDSASFTRADDTGDTGAPVPIHLLTTRQRVIVETIEAYERVDRRDLFDQPAGALPADHRSTLQDHLSALHRKGWLRSPNSPLMIRRDSHAQPR
jgi:hypothetical protein